MATILLLVIYIAFIGLGVPDSLFGAAWPAIYNEFGLPVSYATLFTLTSAVCTFLSSLISSRVINKFGTYAVTAVSTAMTAAALLGVSFTGNFWFMILLAIPMGFGAGAIDSGLNNYVALHYNAMQMNFLHCFYGVGVSVSPYILSFALSGNSGWRGGYRWIGFLQIAIAAILILSLPLWRWHKKHIPPAQQVEKPKTLSAKELLRVKGLPTVWIMFFTAVGIEVCCGAWGSTFLVEHKHMGVDMAAKIVTFYFMGIAVGRFVSGLLSVKLTSRQLILLGVISIGVALVVLGLPFGPGVAGVGLFLCGLGISPIYPNLMHLTPIVFGRDVSQSVMGTQMAAGCLGGMLAPALFGQIAQHVNVGLFPWYMGIFFVCLVVAYLFFIKRGNKA